MFNDDYEVNFSQEIQHKNDVDTSKKENKVSTY